MRKSVWIRILSLILVFSLLTPVTASAVSPWNTQSTRSGYSTLFKGLLDALKKRLGDMFIPETPETPETETTIVTEPEEETATTAATETEPATTVEPETEAPTTEPEAPTTEPETPTTEPEAPTTEPEAPTTEPEAPTTEPEAPTTEPEVEESVELNQTLTVVEADTTVTNGEMLRANTYVLTSSNEAGTYATTSTTLKYFPVTLYNYMNGNKDINSATHAQDIKRNPNLTMWQGIYFGGNDKGADVKNTESYDYEVDAAAHSDLTWADVISGTYYTDEDCTTAATIEPITETEEGDFYTESTVSYSELWNSGDGKYNSWNATDYYYLANETYQTVYIYRQNYNGSYYYYVGYGSNRTTISYGYEGGSVTVYEKTNIRESTIGYNLIADDSTLATLNSTDTTQKIGVTLYTPAGTGTKTVGYADWNKWTGDVTNCNGNYTYSGLAENKLDANKNIIFTKPEGGIFNSDSTVKDIYTNVELPFVYTSDGYYTFDSAANGVYFHEDATQGSSGTPASNTRLYFNEGNVQSWSGMNYGDGSKNLWAPFNDGTDVESHANVDHFYGMNATIPFTMTSDGRMTFDSDKDGKNDEIKFEFSGDDDVWVFVDGTLVLDIGGVHNRLDGTINFAENTWTITADNGANAVPGDANGKALSGKVFNDIEGTGILNIDRATFSAFENHELTIFYLERGAGSSNSKIKFNLPMKDTVSVQKLIDGQAKIDANGNVTIESLSNLSANQLEVLNNQDFTFTAYKNGAILANATYSLLNANGQVIATPATDANGKFTLKNGQTAKFVGTFTSDNEDTDAVVEGDTYRFVEDIKDGFIYTTHSATAVAANDSGISSSAADDDDNKAYTYYTQSGAHYVTNKTYSDGTLESDTWKVSGGDEAEDSLSFVFKNYMNASLPRPSAIPSDDTVVIDYGLPVVVDLFSNDLYLADTTAITFANATNDKGEYVASYGTFTYDSASRKITYQLDKQLTGVEVINYTLIGYAGNEFATGTATVYIIPATTMYYEEDFGLVNYATGTWTSEGTAQDDAQEPGVVGTVGDSPYGSDAAYLNDSGDSNGSSMHVTTNADNSASFSYTFTGTETSFFARTAANTGYMRVVVTDEDGNTLQTYYRDTKYVDDKNAVDVGDTLYNIPVFTWRADEFDRSYGTYTVTVTIAKPVMSYGSEFYLDGIRVVNSLKSDDENYAIATSAYASDGEANMTSITLRNKLLGDADLEEAMDEEGNVIYKYVYKTDENGNYILDENGDKIPVYEDDDNKIHAMEPVLIPVWNDQNGFILFTDSNGAMVAADEYESIGPKEEVYIYGRQSVSFALENWDPNVYDAYLGMKAPTGSAEVTINNKTVTLSNAADCYFEISDYAVITETNGVKTASFTITAGSDCLVSLTNLKVTGSSEFTIVPGTDIEVYGDFDFSDSGNDTSTEEPTTDDSQTEDDSSVTEQTDFDQTVVTAVDSEVINNKIVSATEVPVVKPVIGEMLITE